MRKKRRKQILFFMSFCLLMGGASAGITAAYLKRSPGEVQNVITAGSVRGELSEEHWKPENGRHVYPGQRIAKDPVVENTGENDAWVFLEVSVPMEKTVLVDEGSGRKNSEEKCELFTYHTDNSHWNMISKTIYEDKTEYVYGYNCPLKPGKRTEPLFEEVIAVHYLEGEVDSKKNYDIHVAAKIIQSNTDTYDLNQIYKEILKQYQEDEEGGEV